VADALHTAARASGSQALCRAADGYDRASRSPHGRIPRRTPEGSRLRAAARLLAMTGGTTVDGMGQAGALAANLVALIDAVAGLRRAQARRPSRRRSFGRRGASRSSHRCPGTCDVPRPDLPGTPRPVLTPLPLADVLAATVSTDSAEQRSKPQVPQPGQGLLGKSRHRGLRPTDCPLRRQLWPRRLAPIGRSSSLRCGRSTWTCNAAPAESAAIEEAGSILRPSLRILAD